MKFRTTAIAALLVAVVAPAAPASAELILSTVVLDFDDAARTHDDIEVFNSGDERLFVVVEPAEVLDAGTAQERRQPIDDPDAGGILVSPKRMILEPNERRVARISLLGPAPTRDRVYRLAIKPVVGPVTAEVTALKVLVGYDALVIRRPDHETGNVAGERRGRTLIIRNASNTARELYSGTQCDASGAQCAALPARRLYAGEEWQIELPYDTPANFKMAWGQRSGEIAF